MWRLRARDERYAWRDAKLREGRFLRVEKHIVLHLASRRLHQLKILLDLFVDEAGEESTPKTGPISGRTCAAIGGQCWQHLDNGGRHETITPAPHHTNDPPAGSDGDLRAVAQHRLRLHQARRIPGAG